MDCYAPSDARVAPICKLSSEIPENQMEAAVEYARHGWHVFPIYEIRGDGSCACDKQDCGSPGKHPRILNGFQGSTNDIETVTAWWQRWPLANVGVATGRRSGLVVVDVDRPELLAGLRFNTLTA